MSLLDRFRLWLSSPGPADSRHAGNCVVTDAASDHARRLRNTHSHQVRAGRARARTALRAPDGTFLSREHKAGDPGEGLYQKRHGLAFQGIAFRERWRQTFL